MCLAVPLRIKELNGTDAVVERDGVSRNVKVNFIREPKVGDYVMVHAGFAIEKVDGRQAEEDLEAFRELEAVLRTI
ncbi:MAG: HypC/HybG/HupF family hydrogenase formation chaperone [Lachnospiraceae bacterium]|jgi:hydrogenase expression/formation protein HypC|nr:HypC/HybG/HupF family hydrogenase formation chaperone [Lachnospiraceae bacterium]